MPGQIARGYHKTGRKSIISLLERKTNAVGIQDFLKKGRHSQRFVNFRTHTAVVSPETEHHKVIDGFDPSDRQKTHQILAAIGVKKQTLV